MRLLCLFWFVGITLSASSAAGQDYAVHASHETVLAGSVADVAITMDNLQPIRGFSLGVSHDAAVADLTGIDQGALCLATNGGTGADYVFTDLNPSGGTGGVIGLIVSTDAPIEELPAGIGQEIAIFHYTAIGAAGTTSAIQFDDGFGNPPVANVLSVAGVSHFPVETAGSVTIQPPPVETLACLIVDPCTCEAMASWVNPIVYDEVRVFANGALVSTVTGTSASFVIPAPDPVDVCVIGVAGGIESDPVCCTLECPPVPVPGPPSSLQCVVDPADCSVDLSWTNAETYPEIRLYRDGVLEQTLAGDATSATLTLPGFGSYLLCLEVDGTCGVPPAETCCPAVCDDMTGGTQFVRGDCNVDAMNNIADAVFGLSFLFPGAGGPPALLCVDACDCNDDGQFNIADAICILGSLFGATTVPPMPPFPDCGEDPTDGDPLGCDDYMHCP